jgi:trimeric autotransporter adhesin
VRSSRYSVAAFLLIVMWSGLLLSQEPATAPSSGVVPQLVNFSGKAVDAQGKTISGIAGVTFAIYKDQYEGAPLWMETQNVTADSKGNYTVQLGAVTSSGLPLELFSTGEARWLGVRINGGEEQPRVLLLSVPYALKAADAQTLGGLPASAFALAAPASSGSVALAAAASSSPAGALQPALAGTGTADYIPLWTPNGSTLGDSVLFQSGSGTTARVGINITTPATTLDVKGGATVRGTLSLPASAAATASAGKSSQPLSLTASAFSSTTSTALNQVFQWQAEAAGNDTSTPSGTLNLLFGEGATKPSATGLSIASNGQVTFATGQTFPGAITSVGLSAPSSDFTVTGSPITTSGTLALNWTVAPTNANTPNAIVKRDSNGSFNVAAVVATLGVSGNSTSTSTAGVDGTDTLGGMGVLGVAKGTSGQGVWGESFGTAFAANGQGADGVHGQSHSVNGSGVAGLNSDPNGKGVYAQGGGYGIYAWGTGTSSTGAYGTGGAYGVYGTSSGSTGTGVYGTGLTGVSGYNSTTSAGYGVWGSSTNGVGVYGSGPTGVTGASSTLVGVSGSGPVGVSGTDSSGVGTGVSGTSSGGTGVTGSSTNGYGVTGISTNAYAVYGNSTSSVGVYGNSTGNVGVFGVSSASTGVYGSGATGLYGQGGTTGVSGIGSSYGVYGYGNGTGPGVYGTGNSGLTGVEGVGLGAGTGVYGSSGSGPGVYATSSTGGWAVDAYGSGSATGVLAGSADGYAGWFNGNVTVEGTLYASTKDFKIDHPLDPANKYLFHASVESSEMMNIYTGNVTTDTQGEATVQLPEWFEALNTDFRYQLTVIGVFAQAIVAHEIEQHQFQIRTSMPNVKVSWQVTGVRQDAYAKAHPLQVEQNKPEQERGFYIHPELFGAPQEKGILWATAPRAMKQWKEARAKAAAHGEATPTRP